MRRGVFVVAVLALCALSWQADAAQPRSRIETAMSSLSARARALFRNAVGSSLMQQSVGVKNKVLAAVNTAVAKAKGKKATTKGNGGDDCPGEGSLVATLKNGANTPPECLELIQTTMVYVHNLLTKEKITYWAMKGTLLGLMREQCIIPHDYDIDLAMMAEDINKVSALRKKIWTDGYILVQAPWVKYNNMQLVIIKRTNAVKTYLDKDYPDAAKDFGFNVKFTDGLREAGISAELEAYQKIGNDLVQVLCSAVVKQDGGDGPWWKYDMKMDPKLAEFYKADKEKFEKTKDSHAEAWKTYAKSDDAPFTTYNQYFHNGVSPECRHTAPASFAYDALDADIRPPVAHTYCKDHEIMAPKNAQAILLSYFGPNWRVPQRRYGGKK